MKRALLVSIGCALIFAAATAVAAQERRSVVVVNQALGFFAERLVDDAVDVVFPVPEGVDPSFWRPSIADISAIQSADLILLNGAGFAGWIDRVSLPRSRVLNTTNAVEDQFIVTESITHSHGDGGEHSHEGVASYTWLDPVLAIAQAEAIASGLVARGLADEDEVKSKLAVLTAELSDLDAQSKGALSGARDIAIIATHPRYQYFARRYSLAITSLEWDAGAAPTEDELAELARLATETDARILVWEAQPPDEAVAAVEALGLKSVLFEPGSSKGAKGPYTNAFAEAVAAIAAAASENNY
ncbi:MAG: metal ABC transporter substrate-binding protein [Pseudomonadota bacterium]